MRYFAFLLFIALSACTSGPQRKIASVFEEEAAVWGAVYKGEKLPSDSPFQRSLVTITLPSGIGFIPGGICSGVLLSSDIVLTAAHCIVGTKVSVKFHDPSGTTTTARYVIHPKNQHRKNHSDWKYAWNSIYDVAILKLDRKAPFTPLPLTIPTSEEFDKNGTFLILGVGAVMKAGNLSSIIANAKYGNPPQKAEIKGDLHPQYPGLFDGHGYIKALLNHPETTQKRTAGTCSGDSGGPTIFVTSDKKYHLVGIHSEADCEGGSADEFVPFHRAWILKTVKDLKSSVDI